MIFTPTHVRSQISSPERVAAAKELREEADEIAASRNWSDLNPKAGKVSMDATRLATAELPFTFSRLPRDKGRTRPDTSHLGKSRGRVRGQAPRPSTATAVASEREAAANRGRGQAQTGQGAQARPSTAAERGERPPSRAYVKLLRHQAEQALLGELDLPNDTFDFGRRAKTRSKPPRSMPKTEWVSGQASPLPPTTTVSPAVAVAAATAATTNTTMHQRRSPRPPPPTRSLTRQDFVAGNEAKSRLAREQEERAEKERRARVAREWVRRS